MLRHGKKLPKIWAITQTPPSSCSSILTDLPQGCLGLATWAPLPLPCRWAVPKAILPIRDGLKGSCTAAQRDTSVYFSTSLLSHLYRLPTAGQPAVLDREESLALNGSSTAAQRESRRFVLCSHTSVDHQERHEVSLLWCLAILLDRMRSRRPQAAVGRGYLCQKRTRPAIVEVVSDSSKEGDR